MNTESVPVALGGERWQHLLMSGGLNDRGAPRSGRDWIVDGAVFAVALASGGYVVASTWSQHSSAGQVVDVGLGAIACLALWVRRDYPVFVALLVVAVSSVSGLASLATLPVIFNAAIRASWRDLWVIAVSSVFATITFASLYPDGPDGRGVGWQVTVGVMLTALAIGWGLFVRGQRELVWSLHERAERAEAEERLAEVRAREAERRRIAGEMHDVLAHRLSLLAIHAGALEFRDDVLPKALSDAAGVVRASAYTALDELSQVIGVLRDGDDALAPPQPTLAQVPILVQESRAARMSVDCRIDVPDDVEVPAAVGRAAYRVVQEGLTNAHKHATERSAVDVRIATGDGPCLTVLLISRSPWGAPSRPAPPGAGSGLIGLSERVALAGGSLEHGVDPDGAFALRAVLPWVP